MARTAREERPSAAPAPTVRRPGSVRSLFVVTVFVGSFLLFQVQPMLARLALPDLGGAAAVWNSAMLVYQALLLAGYAWAHVLSRFSLVRQVTMHVALLVGACLWLPIGLASMRPPTGTSVVLFVPLLLVVSVGPVLFAVSAQAPLLQQWYASSSRGRNPYALYAASNLGSFAGLLAYPLVVEPHLRLDLQRWWWSGLYVGLILLVTLCGVAGVAALRRRGESGRTAPTRTSAERQTGRETALWLALSFVPSGLMLSTTTHLTTDIMAMPLLWAIPLGLYLLSFTVAFAERRATAEFVTRLTPLLLLLTGSLALTSGGTGSVSVAVLSLVTFFAVAVALHSRLYLSRPPAERLTAFYLTTAVGGALGGVFCGLVAPLAFDWVYEHPLLTIATALLLPLVPLSRSFDLGSRISSSPRLLPAVVAGVAATVLALVATSWPLLRLGGLALLIVLAILALSSRLLFVLVLVGLMCALGARTTLPPSFDGDRARSYFGVYTVKEEPGRVTLVHGVTVHGIELTTPGDEQVPTTYYGRTSGVGLVLADVPALFGGGASIGVVGLGAGTLACYARPGQQWRFFEIDPLMVTIARDSGRFGFLSSCARSAEIIVGDARLRLEGTPSDVFDVLVVDAFSSDSIPMHLMTREAFDLYDRVVRDDGIVMVHITNRFMELEPVLSALTDHGWVAEVRENYPDREAADRRAETASVWVAMSRSRDSLGRHVDEVGGDWRPLADGGDPQPWTDDFASVVPLLRW